MVKMLLSILATFAWHTLTTEKPLSSVLLCSYASAEYSLVCLPLGIDSNYWVTVTFKSPPASHTHNTIDVNDYDCDNSMVCLNT